jgi:membrane associated rhomboid family serine protease
MGIYDREYYRRDGPSLLSRGQACKWLIIINVVVFIMQMLTTSRPDPLDDIGFVGPGSSFSSLTSFFALDANAVLHGQVWRLLTYAFLHDPNSLWHLVFNMLFLFWFGNDVENLYGSRETVLFYLAAALFGGICFVLANLAGVPGDRCIGASGAVMAIMVLCALHYPHRVLLLFFFLPVPIWIFILFMLGTDAYSLLMALQHHMPVPSQTAVAVHLGGAGFALLYYQQNWRLANLSSGFRDFRRQLSRPRLRVYTEEHVAPQATSRSSGGAGAADVDEQMEAKVDYVLEKVARSGQDSLTESERQILLKASELYKRRRN